VRRATFNNIDITGLGQFHEESVYDKIQYKDTKSKNFNSLPEMTIETPTINPINLLQCGI